MKILKSCGSPSWGGIEIYILRTITELTEMGHDVAVLCLPDSEIFRSAQKQGINFIPILRKGAKRSGEIFQLKRFIENNDFDIVHTHLSNDLWSLVPALNISGKKTPLILTKCMASGVKKKDIFHRYLYKRVAKITAVSKYIKKNVIETCPFPPEKVVVIPDAISLSKWDPLQYDKAQSKTELGFHKNDIVIGIIGRISPGKGHEIFFETVKRIIEKENTDNIRFMVVGAASPGEKYYEERILKAAEELGVKDKITFEGFRDNIPFYLSAMDILAFPSNEESFGGTVLEAMAMKVPVAAFDSGGVPDIIINGETGLLTERNNVIDFTDALLKLIKDQELRKKLANAGRKRVEDHFDLRSNMNRFVELYESLLNKNA
jgi:glycosyltransferase involved in cell wall biosynthesis